MAIYFEIGLPRLYHLPRAAAEVLPVGKNNGIELNLNMGHPIPKLSYF